MSHEHTKKVEHELDKPADEKPDHERRRPSAKGGDDEIGLLTYTPPAITASGTTWAQLQQGGASGHLERLIAAQVGTPNPPAAAALTATGGGTTGGGLAVGSYQVIVTETNGIGETLGTPVSAPVTIAAGNIPQITFAALQAGNSARNVYLCYMQGGPTAYLYAVGVTAATFNLAGAPPPQSGRTPPLVNSTSIATNVVILEMLRGAKTGLLHDAYKFLRCQIEEFIAGRPSPVTLVKVNLAQVQAVFSMLNTLCTEAGTLIDANPGTLGRTIDTIGNSVPRRTWP